MANSKSWVAECKKKAQAGDGDAQRRLAIAYARGIGVRQNDAKARKWLKLGRSWSYMKPKRGLPKVIYMKRALALAFPKRIADLKCPKIQWKECKTVPACDGHGINYVDRRRTETNATVASLEGFEWFHDFPKTVKICCIAPDSITTARELAAMKKAIAKHIFARTAPDYMITPHIEARVNS